MRKKTKILCPVGERLDEFLHENRLTQTEFGKAIGVSQGLVWQWMNGYAKVSAASAKKIELETKGKIRKSDLRPDIWDNA